MRAAVCRTFAEPLVIEDIDLHVLDEAIDKYNKGNIRALDDIMVKRMEVRCRGKKILVVVRVQVDFFEQTVRIPDTK